MNNRTANTNSTITHLMASVCAFAVIGFSGTTNAAPPAPPPAAPPVGNAPPAPPGAAPPAAPPADSAAAQLAPPPPPPAPERTAAPPNAMPPRAPNGGWNGSSPPISWQNADPSMYPPLWPSRIDYEEGDVVPPGYQVKTHPDRSLLTAGMITLLVPYSISFLFGGVFALNGGSNDRDQYGSLLVPIAGPFISIGVGRANGSSVHESEVFFMLADGFAQTAGAAMIVASILVPGKTLERVAALPGKPEVFVGPGSASLRMRF